MPGEIEIKPTRDAMREGFSTTVSRYIVGIVAAALVLASGGIYWAAHESNKVSVERQARSAKHAIEISLDELALQQETVSIWDDSVSHVVNTPENKTWIHDNVGSWLHRIFQHDEVFILDGTDQPIYGAVQGKMISRQRYDVLAPDLKYLVRSVRGLDGGLNGRHDRNPNRPLAANSTVRTTARTTHDSHLMLVDGRPAAASAMLMQTSTPNYVRPKGQWPVLVSVRYLDAGFLAELRSRQLISAPRFSRNSALGRGEYSVPLETEWGTQMGYLVWKPELPGTRILWKLIPLSALILVALACFMGFLGRRLRNAVAEAAAADERAAHLAFHDALTGLPNRAMFQQRLEELTAQRETSAFALVLLDVDDFKLTNDTLGHDAGDAVLLAFAHRLRELASERDVVARLGGDEFALLVADVGASSEVEAFAERVLETLREPCDYGGKLIDCQASVGASLCGSNCTAEDILKHADLALYASKSAGKGGFRLYEQSMWSSMLLRREMLSTAKAALDGDHIRPFYQQKVDLRSGRIIGFEALLRCCGPDELAHGPGLIAAAFEDSALARQLSDRLIDLVIADVAKWLAAGLPFGSVAINAAAAELRGGDFAGRLLDKLKAANVPPERIQVEVTESVLLGRGIDHVERCFRELADAGIKLALDDFGTGFASLSHLKQFPVQILKIDRSFVRDLLVDPEDAAIVDAVLRLARALGLEVVAEGIETQSQCDHLSAFGCSVGQGYLFGPAVPCQRVPDLLNRRLKVVDAAA